MDDRTQESFLRDLCPRVQPLAATALSCKEGCAVLDFFRERRRTWQQVEDIAFYLKQPVEELIGVLNHFVRLGVLQCHEISGERFYSLTRAEAGLNLLEQYWLVRDDWRAEWEGICGTLKFGEPKEARR